MGPLNYIELETRDSLPNKTLPVVRFPHRVFKMGRYFWSAWHKKHSTQLILLCNCAILDLHLWTPFDAKSFVFSRVFKATCRNACVHKAPEDPPKFSLTRQFEATQFLCEIWQHQRLTSSAGNITKYTLICLKTFLNAAKLP